MNGIYDVRASFSKNQVTIAYDPELINKRLRSVLKGCGYTLEEGEPKKEKPLLIIPLTTIGKERA